jgi:hypothetical protein
LVDTHTSGKIHEREDGRFTSYRLICLEPIDSIMTLGVDHGHGSIS